MRIGLGIDLSSARGSRFNRGPVLDADAVFRGPVLDADALSGRSRSWDNDPAYADRVGRYRAGGPVMPLSDKAFAGIYSFARASKAWDVDAFGLLNEVAVDAIRQGYSGGLPAGWLLEGAGTNLVPNPRAEAGGVVPPTGWGASATDSGVAVTWVGQQVINGITCQLVRVVGTPVGVSLTRIQAGTGILGTAALGIMASAYVAVTALTGSLASFTFRFPNSTNSSQSIGIPDATLTRFSSFFGFASDVSQAFQIVPNGVAGQPIDITFAIGAPNAVDGAVLTSPIFPPVGTPAAATRASDDFKVAGAAFTSLFGAGAPRGCIIFDVLPGRAAPSGLDQVIAQLDDGTDNNRMFLRNEAGGLTVLGGVVIGGAAATLTSSAGSLVVGTTARVGLRWGNGAIACCVNGGAPQSLTTALPAPSVQRIGNRADAARSWNSRIRLNRALAYAPVDAEFQARCTLGA